MTPKVIQSKLKQIDKALQDNYALEAYLLHYQLNIALINQFYLKFYGENKTGGKPKKTIDFLWNECVQGSKIKSTINRKNLKLIKNWAEASDQLFKNIRNGIAIKPDKNRIAECRNVFTLLNISLQKHNQQP